MKQLPKTKDNARIGILGGSFDPPHLGHQILAVCALALEKIDELWVLPCADHPFSKKLSPFEHRFKMCEIAFAMLKANVKVVDIERRLPAPNYSVKTLEKIRELRPSIEIDWIMGSDVYLDLPKWKDPQKLATLSQIVVFRRQGTSLSALREIPFPAKVHDQFELPHVKSTEIREMLRDGEAKEGFIDKSVLEYAMKHQLYFSTQR